MTDITNQQTVKGGVTKATVSGLYLAICQNVTPVVVGYLCAHYPIFSEGTWFQIVVFALGGIGGFFVWLTPQHFRQSVVDAIIYVKSTLKAWRDAWEEPAP